MSPFCFQLCPKCGVETTQRILEFDVDGAITTICHECFGVIIHREDGQVDCRDATPEERAVVPVWRESEQKRAERREKGLASLRIWIRSGCPGLTQEFAQAFGPAMMDWL